MNSGIPKRRIQKSEVVPSTLFFSSSDISILKTYRINKEKEIKRNGN